MKAQVNYAGPPPTPGASSPRHAAATTNDATRLADRGRVQP
jgi:hypothetical protein